MDFQITTLPDGLRIATVNSKDANTTTVGAFVGAGSRDETPERNGLSHFLEHMAFKGTESRTAKDIVTQAEAVGGDMNAYTSETHTAFHMNVFHLDTPLAVDVVADILSKPTFVQHELDTERGVILQEIAMYRDDPNARLDDVYQRECYGDHPLGRPILGPVSNIERFSRDDFQSYMSDFYHRDKTVVVAGGRVNHEEFVDQVQTAFAGYGGKTVGAIQNRKPAFRSGYGIDRGDFEQSKVAFGWPVPGWLDIRGYLTANLWSSIVGGGMSSPLFQEVREKRGLCYSVWAYQTDYADTGLLSIVGGTDPSNVEEFIKVSAGEVRKATREITQTDFNRARTQYRVDRVRLTDSPWGSAANAAKALLFHGRRIPVQEMIDTLYSIELDDLYNFATQTLETAPALALTGPVADRDWYGVLTDALKG